MRVLPTIVSRRQALKSLACGFGYLALADLASASNPLAPPPAAPPAPGQARDLSVHAGRPLARRYLRLQAAAGTARRRDARLPRRPHLRPHPDRHPAPRDALAVAVPALWAIRA